jgi:hypothetical protein
MKIPIVCIIAVLFDTSEIISMAGKPEQPKTNVLARVYNGTIGTATALHRSYNSRHDPDTIRKMLCLTLDEEENKKTRDGYSMVQSSFRLCPEESVAFFLKRNSLAVQYSKSLCAEQNPDWHTITDIRTMVKEHGPYLPPFVVETLQKKDAEITAALTKDLLPQSISIENLDVQSQQKLIDSLIKSGQIDQEKYDQGLKNATALAYKRATQEALITVNKQYLVGYFSALPKT